MNRFKPKSISRMIAHAWAGVACLAIVGIAWGVSSPNWLLASALEASNSRIEAISAQSERLQALSRSIHRASHDETMAALSPAAISNPLGGAQTVTVGDRITISNGTETPRTLEVINVREMGPHIMPTKSTTPTTLRLMLVTARTIGAPDAAPFRFIIEAEPPNVPATPRALAIETQRTL